eukprot:8647308-Pyramimonas_sp.AAC.1
MGIESALWVHGGFYSSYMALRPQLVQILSEHLTRRSQHRAVLLTGHSLGGALAVLATFDLATFCDEYSNLRPRELQLYTFGAPRVGLADFATAFAHELAGHTCVRVFTRKDPIACETGHGRGAQGQEGSEVPSVLHKLGYFHVGCPLELSTKEAPDDVVTDAFEKGMKVGRERGLGQGVAT